jgi:NADH:ubiquinone oxidoreductase subunit 3 (subunit A)
LQSPEAMGSTNSTLVFAEILVFMGLLGLAYVYAWRRGVFNWK